MAADGVIRNSKICFFGLFILRKVLPDKLVPGTWSSLFILGVRLFHMDVIWRVLINGADSSFCFQAESLQKFIKKSFFYFDHFKNGYVFQHFPKHQY